MELFSQKKKGIGKEVAESILAQEDRLAALFGILENLPPDLVKWFKGLLKTGGATKGYVEVDLSQIINVVGILPGDLVVRKNRDPKVNDIIEIVTRNPEGYSAQMVTVKKINLRDSTLYVHDPLFPDNKGQIGIANVICVIDKIIKYGDPDWKKTVQLLDISYDEDEITEWVKDNIDFLEKSTNFYEKENNLKKLNERLKILKIK